MVYELRTYTLVPGTQPEYLRLNRDVGRKIRGDKYGTLEGAWTSEFGTLNQYVHLWSYPDLNERDGLRRALGADKAWVQEYVSQIRPLIQTQENKILLAVDRVPLTPPAGGGPHLYELRTYRTHTGKVAEWVGHFTSALPAREKYSKIVGLWTTDVSQLNQVVHLWAYSDLNQRADVRSKVPHDPEWKAMLGKAYPLLAHMESVILAPTETSPLR